MNTIDVLGEEETFRLIIERNITEYEDEIVTKIGRSAFKKCSKLTSVSLPSATSIGPYAFEGCSNLTSVSLPSATSIDFIAFQGCNNLTNVSLPSVTDMGSSVFQDCNNLTSVSLPSLKTLDNYAFENCSNLTSVSLPSATRIGQFAISKCHSLESISLPNVTTVAGASFCYNKKLAIIDMPNLKTIEDAYRYYDSTGAFHNCESLVNVSLPSVTSIGSYAFRRCDKLTSVSLPSATSIAGYAFNSCSSLTTMYIGTKSDKVCTLSSATAIPANVTNIYVPAALIDSYKTATNWSSFADKIKWYEQPVACQSLTITADDVAGYQTTTTIHLEATCTYSIEGVMQSGTMVFKGDAVSDAFSKNPSSDSSRSIEVSYTFLGQTATTTITQSKYVGDPLGGTIFYIDDTADGAYEFYDAEGNVISDIKVGDKPAMYKVLTPGTKDKYYVCNATLYPSLKWNMSSTSTGATGTAIGTGKSNTNIVMATSAATTSETIWYQLAQVRSNSLEGYNDWFIPSKDEMKAVQTSGIISFSSKYIWSSSEESSTNAWFCNNGSWYYNTKSYYRFSVFFVRAF